MVRSASHFIGELMPKKEENNKEVPRWVIYDVPIKLRNEVKVYAIRNNKTVGEVISMIIKDWLDKQNNQEKD